MQPNGSEGIVVLQTMDSGSNPVDLAKRPKRALATASSAFNRLPTEILLQITGYLYRGDDHVAIRSLCYTSRALSLIGQTWLYHSIELQPTFTIFEQADLSSLDSLSGTSKLWLLSRTLGERPELRSLVRRLSVKMVIDPYVEWNQNNWNSDYAPIVETTIYESSSWTVLLELITWLTHVKELNVTTPDYQRYSLVDCPWALYLHATKHLSNLESVRLTTDLIRDPEVLFKNLLTFPKLKSVELPWALSEWKAQPAPPRHSYTLDYPYTLGSVYTPLNIDWHMPAEWKLGKLSKLCIGGDEEIIAWLDFLPLFPKLKALELRSMKKAIRSMIDAHSSLGDALSSVAANLEVLTLHFGECQEDRTVPVLLEHLDLTKFEKLGDLTIINWMFSEEVDDEDELYKYIFSRPLHTLIWHYESRLVSEPYFASDVLLAIDEALIRSTTLRYVDLRISLTLAERDCEYWHDYKFHMAELRNDLRLRGVKGICALDCKSRYIEHGYQKHDEEDKNDHEHFRIGSLN